MEAISKRKDLESFFLDAEYIDIKQIDARSSLRAFIAAMLSYYPWWVVFLLKVRLILVSLLGLVKHDWPEQHTALNPEDISFSPGDRAALFIVRKAEEERFWVSESPEDRHLTAFLGVAADRLRSGKTRFTVFTTVRYLHWTGPVYFNIIRPFHHLVVWRMMKAAAKKTT